MSTASSLLKSKILIRLLAVVFLGLVGLVFQNFTLIGGEGQPISSGLVALALQGRPSEIDLRNFDATVVMPGGRLVLSTGPRGWFVRTFDPNLLRVEAQTQGFIALDAATTGGKTLFQYSYESSENQGKWFRDNGYCRIGHSAASYDPRFGESVYRVSRPEACLQKGSSVRSLNPLGRYECHKLLLMEPFERVPVGTDCQSSHEAGPSILHMSLGTVLVESFTEGTNDRIAQPQVVSATVDREPWKILTERQPNDPELHGYEVSATNDGRLIFFTQLDPRRQAVLFNAQPWNPEVKWTRPLPYGQLTDLGSQSACFSLFPKSLDNCPRGLKMLLGDRYPLLSKPLRLPDGSAFTGRNECVYPWISFDGEEVFCQMKRPSTGFAVAGRRTNWTWMWVDSGFNRTRDREPETCPLPVGPTGKCPSSTRSQSFGMTSGAWAGWKGTDLNRLGLRPQEDQYIMQLAGFASPGGVARRFFGLVGFKSFQDGKYLAYLPMNEMVKEGPSQGHVVDLTTTPDISGQFLQTRFFGSVRFSQDVDAANASSEILPAKKWIGSNLVLDDHSYVTVKPGPFSPSQDQFSRRRAYFTFEAALRLNRGLPPNSQLTGVKIVEIPGMFEVILLKSNRIEVRVYSDGVGLSTGPVAAPIALEKWTHLAITYGVPGRVSVRLYCPDCGSASQEISMERLRRVSGNPEKDEYGPLDAGNGQLILGTSMNLGVGTKYLAFDEVKVSSSVRSDVEISHSSYSGFDTNFRNVQLPGFDGDGKDLGLEEKDIRIPGSVATVVANAQKFRSASELGESLFFDVNLSRNASGRSQGVSCATCHSPSLAFTDGLKVSKGVDNKLGSKNAPTIFNRSFAIRHMFDKRSPSISKQSALPLTNPVEMNANLGAVVSYLRANRLEDFKTVFGPTVAIDENLLYATIGVYMLSKTSGNSVFDRMISGRVAVNPQVFRGYDIFNGKGRCASCHASGNLSDELLHQTGFLANSPMKTPSLRNIGLTAPYFHDGSKATLEEVVDFYARGGDQRTHATEVVGLPLSESERLDLVEFLKSLGNPQ